MCKFAKILELRKYLFQVTKQSSMNRFQMDSEFLLNWLAIFAMSYLLKYWELDCSCHPYCSARFVYHLGALFFEV
jgi:hypothetical protein